MADIIELARLVTKLDEATKHHDRLSRAYGNTLFPSASPVRVVHSFRNDGGDAARKGSFELFLTEQEIQGLMTARLQEAKAEMDRLTVEVAALQSQFMRINVA